MNAPDGERFDARSPVGRYWLLHGVGFKVQRPDGSTIGIVDEVLCDSVRQRAQRVTLRRRRLGWLRRRTTLLPSLVETVVPESKLFIVGAAAGGVRVRGRGRERLRALDARVGAGLARAGAAVRPAASWSRRQAGAALLLTVQAGRRLDRSAAAAWAAAAAQTRRDAPRLGAWLTVRGHAADRAAGRGLRNFAAAVRVAWARLAIAAREGWTRLAAGARAAAHMLGELAVLAAVFVSDTWKKATVPRMPPPGVPRDVPEPEPEAEPQGDLDAPLAREASARRPRVTAARQGSRKRGT